MVTCTVGPATSTETGSGTGPPQAEHTGSVAGHGYKQGGVGDGKAGVGAQAGRQDARLGGRVHYRAGALFSLPALALFSLHGTGRPPPSLFEKQQHADNISGTCMTHSHHLHLHQRHVHITDAPDATCSSMRRPQQHAARSKTRLRQSCSSGDRSNKRHAASDRRTSSDGPA